MRGCSACFGALWRMAPDCRFELVGGPYLSDDGLAAAVRWRVIGTMTGPWQAASAPCLAPTGAPFTGEIAGFYEIANGRITRGRVIANQIDMAIQFGALPPRGSRGERLGAAIQRLKARRMRRRTRG
jgi:SnoaL-like polyketide cyclase